MDIESIPAGRRALLEHPIIHSASFGFSPEMQTVFSAVGENSAREISEFAARLQNGTDAYELGIVEHRRAGLRMVLASTELHLVRAAADDLGRDTAVVHAFMAAFALAERWGSGTVNYVHLSQGCWPDIEKKMVASMSATGNWRPAPWLQTLRPGHLDHAGMGEIAAIRDELTREGLDFRWGPVSRFSGRSMWSTEGCTISR